MLNFSGETILTRILMIEKYRVQTLINSDTLKEKHE